jgi:hypothetical protein
MSVRPESAGPVRVLPIVLNAPQKSEAEIQGGAGQRAREDDEICERCERSAERVFHTRIWLPAIPLDVFHDGMDFVMALDLLAPPAGPRTLVQLAGEV